MDTDRLRLLIGQVNDVKYLLFTIFDAMNRNAFDAKFYSHAVYIAHEYLSGTVSELSALADTVPDAETDISMEE